MPIVTESSSDSDRVFGVRSGTGSITSAPYLNGRHRNQTGFRSIPLSEEQISRLSENSVSGNVVSLIKAYEEEDHPQLLRAYAQHNNRVWNVNPRDYTEKTYKPTGFTTSYFNGTTTRTTQGAMGISSLLLGTSYLPSLASEFTLSGIAGGMLRNSRPPKAGFDLARFAGEQREAPLLFRMSNYMPRSKKDLGGAVLNFLFGIKPTGSDLGKLAELVTRSDSGLRQMLSVERVKEKKYSSRVLSAQSGGYTSVLSGTNTTASGGSLSLGWATLKYHYLVYSSTGGVVKPVLTTSWTSKQTLRTFATWEYFVPKPYEIETRLDLYKSKAQEILGAAKLTEGTVYDLTPWTWLGNWFVDVGGLLRYQRDVVDNQIVATTCGYSVWEEFTGFVHYAGRQLTSPARDDVFTPVQASIRYRHHMRRGGSPYSINPTWSLNNQQWGILGALGLSRGVDMPNLK